MQRRATFALATLLVFAAPPATGLAGARAPVVVELFTSQGCSSCPPANANLAKISRRADVLALSFSVTYWDGLGWKDVFGKPEFTQRQYAYESALGESGPFTPQIVVNGRRFLVGADLDEVEAAIATQSRDPGPAIRLEKERAHIGVGPAPAAGADVWLVRYEPGVIDVPVRRGENADKTLPHAHVVRSLARIGAWTGAAADYALPGGGGALRTAVLLQTRGGGPILAATTD
jgi:hypothetical protein